MSDGAYPRKAGERIIFKEPADIPDQRVSMENTGEVGRPGRRLDGTPRQFKADVVLQHIQENGATPSHAAKMAEVLEVPIATIQSAVNRYRKHIPQIQIVVPGRIWKYVDDKDAASLTKPAPEPQVVPEPEAEKAKTKAKAKAKPVNVAAPAQGETATPKVRASRLRPGLFEEIGHTSDGKPVLKDETGQLWQATRL